MSEPLSNVDPDDTLQCYIDLTEIRRQEIKLREKKKTAKTNWEARGVDVEAVSGVIVLERKDSPLLWMRRLRRAAEIAGVLATEMEENGQVSMIPALPSKTAQERKDAQEAFWKGWDAGNTGDELDANPHPTGSEQFGQWRDGWSDGVDEKKSRDEAKAAKKEARKEAKNEAQNATPAPTEVRPRGRPRKNQEAPPTALEKDEANYRAKGTGGQAPPPPE